MDKRDSQWATMLLFVVIVLLVTFGLTLNQLASEECQRAGYDTGYYKTTFRQDLHIVCEYRTAIDLSDVLREEYRE